MEWCVTYINVHNFSDIDAIIYPQIKLGVGESDYEKEIVSVCHSELSTSANAVRVFERFVRKGFLII